MENLAHTMTWNHLLVKLFTEAAFVNEKGNVLCHVKWISYNIYLQVLKV
jgi:hypothetical protein